jgi:hypothetical protein
MIFSHPVSGHGHRKFGSHKHVQRVRRQWINVLEAKKVVSWWRGWRNDKLPLSQIYREISDRPFKTRVSPMNECEGRLTVFAW